MTNTWVLYAFSLLFFTATWKDSSVLLGLTITGAELQHASESAGG